MVNSIEDHVSLFVLVRIMFYWCVLSVLVGSCLSDNL